MKKKTLSILSLCIALFAAFALVGCGGSASGGGGSTAKSESKEKAPVAKKTRTPRPIALSPFGKKR